MDLPASKLQLSFSESSVNTFAVTAYVTREAICRAARKSFQVFSPGVYSLSVSGEKCEEGGEELAWKRAAGICYILPTDPTEREGGREGSSNFAGSATTLRLPSLSLSLSRLSLAVQGAISAPSSCWWNSQGTSSSSILSSDILWQPVQKIRNSIAILPTIY